MARCSATIKLLYSPGELKVWAAAELRPARVRVAARPRVERRISGTKRMENGKSTDGKCNRHGVRNRHAAPILHARLPAPGPANLPQGVEGRLGQQRVR